MKKRELEDSEELRAAVADLREKAAADKEAAILEAANNEAAGSEAENTGSLTEEEQTEASDYSDAASDAEQYPDEEGYEAESEEYDSSEEYDGIFDEDDVEVQLKPSEMFQKTLRDTVPMDETMVALAEAQERKKKKKEKNKRERAVLKEDKDTSDQQSAFSDAEKSQKSKGLLGKKRKRLNSGKDNIIVLDNVTKYYEHKPSPALNKVNITIKKGEFVFIVGESGSGKSTLIRLLLRETLPTEGSITVGDFKLDRLRRSRVPKLRRTMGVVFQDFRLLKDRNVYDNVAFAQRIVEASPRQMRKNVPAILGKVGLAGKYRARTDELSGGEQQRVALARALVNKPQILLADEPTGNLDPKNTIEIMNLLEQVNKEGTTVLVVTHNDKIVNNMNHRVITIKKGVVISDIEEGNYDNED
ncbi:cell division ATP-binding protein FtsE [Lachnospiraceae bacterium XPB1003]|nr:cell division ATP-binding protein FtsE [Lachnospiraceae bacterium XPB1003]